MTQPLQHTDPGGDPLAHRRAKLDHWRTANVDPFPRRFARSHLAQDVLGSFETLAEKSVSVAGRIISWRAHGKSTFFHILDGSGRIQCYAKADVLGAETYSRLDWFDVGDFVGVTGTVFRTRTDEVTVRVEAIELLSKSLRPLPEKWHGLVDKELRYRRRYLDLIANAEVRDLFVKRAQILSHVRRFLDARGFLEVETPVLQPLYGGAAARPFTTYHNSLDAEFYLRIADELYLKRLIVGGYEKVYEVCKDFRNEGIDRDHNPEFTMVELYVAYADYRDIMTLFREMLIEVATVVRGEPTIEFEGQTVDISGTWPEIPLLDAIREATGCDLTVSDDDAARRAARAIGVELPDDATYGKVVDEVFTQRVQPDLIAPTFITDYPEEISPLAKKHRAKPGLVERFELFITRREIGNAFSELNDPDDQRARFEAMAQAAQRGDAEAHRLDEDYLFALEHGMPPTGGLGFGLDRLVMVLTGAPTIREVILFPTLRPLSGGDGPDA
ncbi:MAG TPA: lysine--tRNA ligase [Acidobacteriota bacterium]|nr:lysine--tRNA ligase [Acidobacteriota bacterium]